MLFLNTLKIEVCLWVPVTKNFLKGVGRKSKKEAKKKGPGARQEIIVPTP